MEFIKIDTYTAHMLLELANKNIRILSRLKTEAIDEVASLLQYNLRANGDTSRKWQDVPAGRKNLVNFIIDNIDKDWQ